MAFEKPATFLTATGFDRAVIVRGAWSLARHRAERDGTAARAEFANALSGYWHTARLEADCAGRNQKFRMVRCWVASQVERYGTTAHGRAA